MIDFNVHGPPTDGLMFDWSELTLFPIDKVRALIKLEFFKLLGGI